MVLSHFTNFHSQNPDISKGIHIIWNFVWGWKITLHWIRNLTTKSWSNYII